MSRSDNKKYSNRFFTPQIFRPIAYGVVEVGFADLIAGADEPSLNRRTGFRGGGPQQGVALLFEFEARVDMALAFVPGRGVADELRADQSAVV